MRSNGDSAAERQQAHASGAANRLCLPTFGKRAAANPHRYQQATLPRRNTHPVSPTHPTPPRPASCCACLPKALHPLLSCEAECLGLGRHQHAQRAAGRGASGHRWVHVAGVCPRAPWAGQGTVGRVGLTR